MSARRGSTAFANDWQWLLGFPALAAVLWFFRAYLSEDTEKLLSGGTAFGTLMAALIAFLITMFVCFLVRLLIEPPKFFYQEKDRADAAEQRLVPKISVFLDPACNGVRLAGTRLNLPPGTPTQRGPNSKWVQIMVQSATNAPLVGCEARLIRVEQIDNSGAVLKTIETEPVFCSWSNALADERVRMTIPSKIPQAANILSVHHGIAKLNIETTPLKYDYEDEVQNAGTYRLKIAVSAKDCPTEIKTYRIKWGGSYDSISITEE